MRLLHAAHAAFVEAFAMLRAAPPAGFVLATAHEKVITRQLKDTLANDLLPNSTVPGFNKTFFSYVTRDAELTSYDGSIPTKSRTFCSACSGPPARASSPTRMASSSNASRRMRRTRSPRSMA